MLYYYAMELLSNYGGYKNAFLTTKFRVPSRTFEMLDGVNEDYMSGEKLSIFVLITRPYLLSDFSSFNLRIGLVIVGLNISLDLLLVILFNGGNSKDA